MCRVVTTDVLKMALRDHQELMGSGRVYGNMINLINAVATAQRVSCPSCPHGDPEGRLIKCRELGSYMNPTDFCGRHPQLAPLREPEGSPELTRFISFPELQEAWKQSHVGANDGHDIMVAFEDWMKKLGRTVSYSLEE